MRFLFLYILVADAIANTPPDRYRDGLFAKNVLRTFFIARSGHELVRALQFYNPNHNDNRN